MKHSLGVEHCWFSIVLWLWQKGRDAVFRLFKQMGSLLRGRLLRFASLWRNLIQIPCTFMHFGDNKPRPEKTYFVHEDKAKKRGTGWNFSICVSLSNLKKACFQIFCFILNWLHTLTWPGPGPLVDLVWESIDRWQQGLIYGGTRLLDKKKEGSTFGTLLCG
jgi:hypothetical protein